MADTAVERLVKRVTARVCENDHPLPTDASFCAKCGKGPKVSTMTDPERLNEIEAALVEFLTVGASKTKTDDESFWAKIQRVLNTQVNLPSGKSREAEQKKE